jgi:dipeptidase E
MKRIVLFSTLAASNEETILARIVPTSIQNKTIAYMPSDGIESAREYIKQWQAVAHKNNAKFNVINNRSKSIREKAKLLSSNILVISGGNTFNLLRNLRESGLDKSIKEFVAKPEFILAGFSAGAIVLTPTIAVCNLPVFGKNMAGIDDLSGLGIVNFEIFPHYDKQTQKTVLENYRKTTTNKIR